MNLNSEKYKNFIESVKFGNIKEAKSNFDIKYFDKEDKYGLKPIHWACLSSDIDILKWMLQENCDIDTLSRNGWRPIHFASFIGNKKIVQYLIENFCNFDCKTDNGEIVVDIDSGVFNSEFIDDILNENINLKIGLSMGLKCGSDCNHEFCLRSVIRCKFDKDEQIGLGRFAIIQKVIDLQKNQQFAVKSVKKYYYDSFENVKCILRNINQILPNLNHSNIVKLFGKTETNIEIILFMELMDKGTLYDEIRKTGALDYDKIGRYCKDILEAVAFLHNKKILHGFINPTNILIDNKDGCKLAISIFSCSLADGDVHNDKKVWESDYLYNLLAAPEIINNQPLSYPYDIWWIGCTVVDMLKGDYLRYRLNSIGELKKIISEISDDILKSFFKEILIETPKERASANELLNHEFIKNTNIIDQSINVNPPTNQNPTIKIIKNVIENEKIGLSMGLKCENKCKHEFCLSSVAATNFKKGVYIGTGYFTKVYKIKLKPEEYWAMKIITDVNENIINEGKYLENDINQYRESINHVNIVKYFGAVRNFKKIFIFMEFIDGDSIYQKIKENKCKPLPLTTIKRYTKQILEGLQFLHKEKIIHRDIKSDNILINKNDIVKISDFGMSRFLKTISKNRKKSFCGTPNYMSPEVILDEPYDCSADIWSLGATVFDMVTGHPPYHDIIEIAVLFKIAETKTIEYPPNMSDDIRVFLNLMIVADPKNRSSAESLLTCKFLN